MFSFIKGGKGGVLGIGWEFFNFNFWYDSVLSILLFQGEFKGFYKSISGSNISEYWRNTTEIRQIDTEIWTLKIMSNTCKNQTLAIWQRCGNYSYNETHINLEIVTYYF